MLARLPFPLVALCLTAFLLGTTWSLLTPPFQAPDENAHFSYTEYLARTGHLPGAPLKPPFSTEQREAGIASNSDQVAGNLATKMSWSPQDWRAWQRKDDQVPEAQKRDSGGPVSASPNPPLYYLYAAIPAKATSGSNLFTRLIWERLASMLWAVALVAFAWLLAGEVFNRDRQLQFVAAGVAGLLPMVQFVSASVTPDSMLYAVWAAVLWRGTMVLKRGLDLVNAVTFLAVVGAACVVKATSYALLPGALLVLGVGLWRMRRYGARALWPLLAAGAGLALTLGIWFFIAHQSHRSAAAQVSDATSTGLPFHLHDFLGYLYQYYFPRLPGQGSYPFPAYFDGVPFYTVVLRGVFGTFGWTEARLPVALYTVLTALSGVLAAAAVAALIRFRKLIDIPVLIFFVVTVLALMAGLQWTDYQKLRESGYTTGFNQGRYLLPLAALGGLGVAAAIRLIPRTLRTAAGASIVGGLVIFNVFSFGVVAWRFYA